MAQINPEERYNDQVMDRVVRFLQTHDPQLFPFTAGFDEHQLAAFVRDLREGLSMISDSGSARKSAATGFTTSDQSLRRVVDEWSAAGGGWPEGSFPQDPVTSLGSSAPQDTPPVRLRARREIRELNPRGE